MGLSFIDIIAKDLKIEFPNLKGISACNLRYTQEFTNDNFFSNCRKICDSC
ncbi:MAG TPA: hypothetical protein IAB49_00125 [Candidatus Caccenecus avistercoris]|nr:hypothetical protein [Candidatus Caccenecus avistercoris]